MKVRRGSAVLAVMLSVGGCGGATADSGPANAPAASATAATSEPLATPNAMNGATAGTPGSTSPNAVAESSDAPDAKAPSAVGASGDAPPPKTTRDGSKPAARSKDISEPKKAAATASPASAPAATPEQPPGSPRTFDCGDKGQKPCPLQAWMKANMAAAVAAGDTAQLATQFDYVAAHTPPGLPNWASIAKLGASKARAADLDGAKATCKSCHDQYKAKYRQQLRDRAF